MNNIFLLFYSVFPQASRPSMNFNTKESCGYCPTKLHGRIVRVKFAVFKKKTSYSYDYNYSFYCKSHGKYHVIAY